MPRAAAFAVPMLIAAFAAAAPSGAARAQQQPDTSAATEPEPLVRNVVRHARPRIRVYPRYPYRTYHSLYPIPYEAEYPGPNAQRQCVARYVTEYRPSGTVVVPRVRCWWVRG